MHLMLVYFFLLHELCDRVGPNRVIGFVDPRVADFFGPTRRLRGPPSLGLGHVCYFHFMFMLLIFVKAMLLFSYCLHVSIAC